MAKNLNFDCRNFWKYIYNRFLFLCFGACAVGQWTLRTCILNAGVDRRLWNEVVCLLSDNAYEKITRNGIIVVNVKERFDNTISVTYVTRVKNKQFLDDCRELCYMGAYVGLFLIFSCIVVGLLWAFWWGFGSAWQMTLGFAISIITYVSLRFIWVLGRWYTETKYFSVKRRVDFSNSVTAVNSREHQTNAQPKKQTHDIAVNTILSASSFSLQPIDKHNDQQKINNFV